MLLASMCDMKRTRFHPGFTLVELLVVIGIISMLIAILLPALSAAQESSRSVACLSNLRQMGMAAHMYAADHAGLLPSGYYGAHNPPLSISYNWDFTIITDTSTGQRTIKPGLLWQGKGNLKIQQCPSYDGKSNTMADPYTGYNYNVSFVGGGQLEDGKTPARLAQIRRAERCALFGDGQFSGGANKFMRSPSPGPQDAAFKTRHAGTQGFRHRGATNVCFADGHAQSLAQRHTAGMNLAPGTGFLSPDNSLYDLK